MLTAERLRQVVTYDARAGVFTRLESSKQAKAGEVPGSIHSHGYRVIGIDGKKYPAHRLAWLYVYGEWPEGYVDHIDRDRMNNGIENLRVVDFEGNAQNRSAVSGRFVGTSYRKKERRWTAQIRAKGRNYHLGYFNCETAAHLAYLRAKPKHHALGGYIG